ncbi:MAG: lysine--tRNA ligase [candidate division FCPU426 bacterium]
MDLLNEYAKERLAKVEALKALGIQPYAYAFDRTHDSAAIHKAWDHLAIGDHAPETVRFAGRVITLRGQGKAAFVTLGDQAGKLQAYIKLDIVGEETFREVFKRLDLGDFIGVEGPVFRTRTNELTVEAQKLVVLTKALLPPPDKWHGLQDTELRTRQRYLDLSANEGVREGFVKRSRVLSGIRSFLEAKGFLEVETPILQDIPGGAAARPFVTHHNTLDMELYLRIAPELYLKRLLVGGFEKVFEMNRNFRNEGISIKHNPEFTMVEMYQAYANGEAMMALTEELIADACVKACGSTKIAYQGMELDMGAPFRRLGMLQAVKEIGGVDPETFGQADWDQHLREVPPARRAAMSPGQKLEHLFSALVEPKLVQPTFITDYPLDISPLAKRKPGKEDIADRFELFIYGREIANGFSELNDPMDQWSRFKAQLEAKNAGDEEAQPMDEDFIRALMHGMPPAGGMGLGVDRLVMFLCDAASIRDVILFPQLRRQSENHGV